jgi:hypothetical protein
MQWNGSKGFRVSALAGIAAVVVTTAGRTGAQPANRTAAHGVDGGWPREFKNEGARLVVYQPQIDSWENYRKSKARAAVALTPTGATKPTYGVLCVKADTQADLETRTVLIGKISIESARFPASEPGAAAGLISTARDLIPAAPITISMDRLIAGLDRTRAATREARVSLAPPTIFASQGPAILVIIDGKPALSDVWGTHLQFVVNTNWDLFYQPRSGRYYLLRGSAWLTAASVEGVSVVAASVVAAGSSRRRTLGLGTRKERGMNSRMAGISLIAAGALFWLSWLLMPGVGVTDAKQIFELVASQRPLVACSVVVQLLSAVLYVPASLGIVSSPVLGSESQVRRGAGLLLVGAMGSAADAVLHLLAYAMTEPGLERGSLVPVMAFMQGPGLLLLAPLIACFFIGGAWLSSALARAGVVASGNARLYLGALGIVMVGGLLASRGWVPARVVGLTALGVISGLQIGLGIALLNRRAGKGKA